MQMHNYFSHDSNARNADNILSLRMRMGAEGYGIYFMILERLREEPDYSSVKDYNMLAFDFRVGSDKVKTVVEDFGLFHFTGNGERFYSESLLRRMQIKDEKTEKAKAAAAKRWEKTRLNSPSDAIALPSHLEIAADKEKQRTTCFCRSGSNRYGRTQRTVHGRPRRIHPPIRLRSDPRVRRLLDRNDPFGTENAI